MSGPVTISEILAAGDDAAEAIGAPGARPLTYAGLREQVARAVLALNGFDVGRSDRVAIVLPNGPEMAVAFLAAATAATAAPLNPAYRAEEFEFYLSDLRAKALLVEHGTQSPAVSVAAKLGVTLVELNPTPELGAGAFELTSTPIGSGGNATRRAPAVRKHRSDPAYVGHDVAAEARSADPA